MHENHELLVKNFLTYILTTFGDNGKQKTDLNETTYDIYTSLFSDKTKKKREKSVILSETVILHFNVLPALVFKRYLEVEIIFNKRITYFIRESVH